MKFKGKVDMNQMINVLSNSREKNAKAPQGDHSRDIQASNSL